MEKAVNDAHNHARNLDIFTGWRRTKGRQRVWFADGKPAHEPNSNSSKRRKNSRGKRHKSE